MLTYERKKEEFDQELKEFGDKFKEEQDGYYFEFEYTYGDTNDWDDNVPRVERIWESGWCGIYLDIPTSPFLSGKYFEQLCLNNQEEMGEIETENGFYNDHSFTYSEKYFTFQLKNCVGEDPKEFDVFLDHLKDVIDFECDTPDPPQPNYYQEDLDLWKKRLPILSKLDVDLIEKIEKDEDSVWDWGDFCSEQSITEDVWNSVESIMKSFEEYSKGDN